MRITKISLKNMRQHRDTVVVYPPGELTLLMGENDAGKTTIGTVGLRWCLWGTTPGRLQDDLLRHGERDPGRTNEAVSSREMIAVVEFTANGNPYIVTRRFVLSPSGHGGTTALALTSYNGHNLSGAINADTQQKIIDLIGTDAMFVATAMTTQRDGPQQFFTMLPAGRRTLLRELVAVGNRWDLMADKAKAVRQHSEKQLADLETRLSVHKTGSAKLPNLEIEIGAAKSTLMMHTSAVSHQQETVDCLVRKAADAEGLENRWIAWASIGRQIRTAEEALVAIDESIKKYDAVLACEGDIRERVDIEADRIIAYVKVRDNYLDERAAYDVDVVTFNTARTAHDREVKTLMDEHLSLGRLADEYDDIDAVALPRLHEQNGDQILEGIDGATPCPHCGQLMETEDAKERHAAQRQLVQDEINSKRQRLSEIGPDIFDRVRKANVAYAEVSSAEPPVNPVAPVAPPEFVSPAGLDREAHELDVAKAERPKQIALKDKNDRVIQECKDALKEFGDEEPHRQHDEVERLYEKLDFEKVVQETVNRQLSRATQEVGRINGAVDTAKQAGVEADALTPEITDLEAKIDALEVVERMTSTAGVPQLMIDQALIQLQISANDWLKRLLPGYSVYFTTQSETGHETLTEGIRIPAGDIVSFADLGGAASTGVALAVREALAEIAQGSRGISHDCRFYDEADAALVGEKQEAYLRMLMAIAATGKTVVAISHITEIQERVDNQIVLVATPEGTKVAA
jgi:DNA repair exonuclease SbcCD ATPase subunit